MATEKEYQNYMNQAIQNATVNDAKTGYRQPSMGEPIDSPVDENTNINKYDELRNVSYKELLNSKIQANAVKEQTQKYLNNNLSANGYNGTGLAESSRLGITNIYQNAIQNANQKYQDSLLNIETQRANDLETQSVDRWQGAMEMLQQATTQEDLDYVKNNFYDTMTDDQKKYFDYYYSIYSRDIENQPNNGNGEFAGEYNFTSANGNRYKVEPSNTNKSIRISYGDNSMTFGLQDYLGNVYGNHNVGEIFNENGAYIIKMADGSYKVILVKTNQNDFINNL